MPSSAQANCSADGAVGCVTTATYKSADTAAFVAADLKSGKTVAGIAGSLANCSSDGGVGCVTTSTYKAANMTNVTAGNIKSGVTIAGQMGDYPSATNPLADNTAATDLPSLAASVAAGSYEWFKSDGSLVSGSITDAGTVTPSSSNQNFTTSVYRQFTVNGDADLVASNIKNAIDIFGVTGNVAAESHSNCTGNAQVGCVTTSTYKSGDLTNLTAGNIKSGVSIAGTAGSYPSATYPLTGASGAVADLDATTFDSKMKSATAFEWFGPDGTRYTGAGDADITTANFVSTVTVFGTTGSIANCAADGVSNCLTTSVYKSADTNAYTAWDIRKGKTVGGKAGNIAFFKNLVNTSLYNRTSGTGASSGVDEYDTIDDYNNGGSFPTQTPGWDQVTSSVWLRYAASDTGSGSGGVAGDGLCNGTEACIFIDQVTGLYWSDDDNSQYSWSGAIAECEGRTTGGFTDWRLPTQKEYFQAYIDGIWSQKASNRLDLNDNAYWTATSRSENTSSARYFWVNKGYADSNDKTASTYILCVRP